MHEFMNLSFSLAAVLQEIIFQYIYGPGETLEEFIDLAKSFIEQAG